ncbi:CynX/NimT family MFS transporter [Chryseomicrobium aureum]|jgi:MFS transporter, CP family, cyanate transporter|uniref:CynX/NimT family MFS transporter n=1 Tax=Chryseomicrobium aureum TaxID=1441723 RepID=UPI001EF7CE83|nr:MFS transporter [Chryseomicrobium aureum]MBM7705909.1 CP family cyanate transporter-like MFS transporter [Chryseomicrobium aureum]
MTKPTKQQGLVLFILGIIFLSLTLRSPLTAVGPVTEFIQNGLMMSTTLIGLLTTIPLLAFAVVSPFAPKVAKQIGTEATLLWSIVLLVGGIALRSGGSITLLIFGTAIIGVAIAFGNVLLPSIIKDRFPLHVGLLTAVFSVVMNLSAALGAGIAYPVAAETSFGWQGSLGVWAILGVLAIVIWLPQLKHRKTEPIDATSEIVDNPSILKSPVTWSVTLMMALQSLIFYTTAAWLPAMLIEKGMSPDSAGYMLSFMQFAQLPMTFIAPILAAKMVNQRPLVWFFSVLYIIGFTGLLLDPNGAMTILWMILIGFAGGTSFALTMMMFTLRTKTAMDAAELSGIAQSIGYLLAAAGPVLFAFVNETTGSWYVPTILFIVTCVLLLVAALHAAGNRYVRN